jgi:biopolymer transport protein ExbB/TolQ
MPIWMIIVEWLARLILLLLVVLSIWSVSIIIDRRRFLAQFKVQDLVDKLIGVASTHRFNRINQAISKDLFAAKQQMNKGLEILGTLGSTTPFIGLLGTIFGIIVAFGELSQGKADTNAIMFALAEALILTAVGLFVAIPAVISFNLFNKKIKNILAEAQSGLDSYLADKED